MNVCLASVELPYEGRKCKDTEMCALPSCHTKEGKARKAKFSLEESSYIHPPCHQAIAKGSKSTISQIDPILKEIFCASARARASLLNIMAHENNTSIALRSAGVMPE